MAYGLKIYDDDGNSLLVTTDIISIASAGRIATPASLEGDNTYGNDIDLPGTYVYSEDDIGVITNAFISNYDVHLLMTESTGYWFSSYYMNNVSTYYTRNETTGVLTSFTPGNHSSSTTHDSLISVYPRTCWDKLDETSFTEVRLFSASTHYLYDYSASAYKFAYSVGTEGVENVDYAIFLRRYHE